MPTLRGRIPDSLSTAASAGTGLGSINPRMPSEVRSAQLVVASQVVDDPRAAADDPAARAEIREVLRALGICSAQAKMQEIRGKRPVGTIAVRTHPDAPRRRGKKLETERRSTAG